MLTIGPNEQYYATFPDPDAKRWYSEPWLSELSGLSGTIGPLSAHYRATIGSDSGSAAIGAIGHYRGTIGPFQIQVRMFRVTIGRTHEVCH